MLYFDHNATTPLLPEARQAWLEAAENFVGNPSSPHRLGARADAALQNARERLAKIIGCDALEIVWTSGATESNNAVLHHLARACPNAQVWISASEHPCLLDTAKFYFPKKCRLIPVTYSGVIDLEWLEKQLKRQRPGLIAVMAANNETGVLQPWREVLSLCRQREVPFFCDAAQWIGKLPASGLGECHFLSGSAHKFGGPRGVGFLKVPLRERLHPLLLGGKQEDGRRAGTENVAGVLSMLAALECREQLLAAKEQEKRLGWRHDFEKRLLTALPGSEVVGTGAERLWNTVSALMPEASCQQRWVVRLDKFGYAVSTGSACASGREEASHVLGAMGYTLANTDRVLRFSSGWETRAEDWLDLLKGLRKAWESFEK